MDFSDKTDEDGANTTEELLHKEELANRLLAIDLNSMSPLAVVNLISDLKAEYSPEENHEK